MINKSFFYQHTKTDQTEMTDVDAPPFPFSPIDEDRDRKRMKMTLGQFGANETLTYTFSESVENHTGMQQIGNKADRGFSKEALRDAKKRFEAAGATCRLYCLNDSLPDGTESADTAHVLVVERGLGLLIGEHGTDSLVDELKGQVAVVDKHAFMKGRVVNKLARWNLCYGDSEQEPDYDNKKGRILAFSNSPVLSSVRDTLSRYLSGARDLYAELNYYYDINKCGIGFHGDTERRKVVGVRVGASMPLHFQWFQRSLPIGERVVIPLNQGDIYVMSEKAVGTDWQKKTIPTLRHATGCSKFTTIVTKPRTSDNAE